MRERTSLLGINMAMRANRRWLVSAVYLVFAIAWAIVWTSGSSGIPLLVLGTIVNGFILGGYGPGGLIKPFATRAPLGAPATWHNDERELRGRDRMHFYAYRVVVPLLLAGCVLGTAPFHLPDVSRALVLTGMVLGPTLPQALLLWTEPDMEFEDAAEGAPVPR